MGPQSSPASTFLLIALMVVAFYFLIIRPNKKRQQAHEKTMSSLAPGSRVLLSSGVFGTIVELGEKQAVLEVSPGVELTVLKGAIARQVLPEDEDFEYESDDDSVEDGPDGQPVTGISPVADAAPAGSGSSAYSAYEPSATDSSAIDFSRPDQDRPGTSTQPIKD